MAKRQDYDYLIKLLLIGDSGIRAAQVNCLNASTNASNRLLGNKKCIPFYAFEYYAYQELHKVKNRANTTGRVCDSGVGKSCLLLRFAEDSFTSSFITTIGIDFKIKKVQLDNKWVKLQIWDTAGQERFRTITSAYYRGAMGILLVYDVSDENSFNNIRNWMKNIEQHASDNVLKVLVGNKSDLDESKRAVSTQRGQALANEFKIPFFETSAKTGSHVEQVFLTMARDIMGRLRDAGPDSNLGAPASLRVGQAQRRTTQKSSCC